MKIKEELETLSELERLRRAVSYKGDCGNAGMGSYTGCVTLTAPNGKIVSIDACILSEVVGLWEMGIVTYESCCGHNVSDSYIAVAPEFDFQMITLGYERNQNTDAPSVFYSKTSKHGKKACRLS